MTRRRRFAQRKADLRRGLPRLPPSGHAFLIVTEGLKTEPNYLKALRQRLQLSEVDVEIIHPSGTDPKTLTDKAMRLRDKRRHEAHKDSWLVDYDEVWVVFDLEAENHPRRQQAREAMDRNRTDTKGIRFAYSNPSFEYWLLLHETYTTAPFADSQAVKQRLKQYWKDYDKGETPSLEFIGKAPTAVTNAVRCRKHHASAPGGSGNPSTEVDKLVRSLNGATRPHLQFQLV